MEMFGRHAGQLTYVGRCRIMCTALGMVEPEFVGHPKKSFKWYATRRFRFDVRSAGKLHSIVFHGHIEEPNNDRCESV